MRLNLSRIACHQEEFNYQIVLCIAYTELSELRNAGVSNMKYVFIGVMALNLCAASAASASSWVVKGEDDLFSQVGKATLMAIIDPSASVYAKCENKKVRLSIIFRNKWDAAFEGIPVDFVYRVDNLSNVIRRGDFYEHNSNFTGVEMHYGYDALVALDAFSRAEKKILIGFDIGKARESESVPVRGSTDAVARFWRACDIDIKDELKTLGRPAG